jgi:RNA polymerase sigma factor (TIGR02999 family)
MSGPNSISSRGSGLGADDLFPIVYSELRKLAAAKMAHERRGHTLQATELVHEALLRLGMEAQFENRAHFFGAAAEAMRRILVDSARRKLASRHGGGREKVDVDGIEIPMPAQDDNSLLALNEALEQLAIQDSAMANIVKLRYFAGLTLKEVAEALGLSERTAKRHWSYAKAWLFDSIRKNQHA